MSKYDDENAKDFEEIAEGDMTRIVIRLSPLRIGMTVLIIVIGCYMAMVENWLAMLMTLPLLVYQWKYYMTFDDNCRMAYMGTTVVQALQAIDADYKKFREQVKQKLGDDDGSAA